MSTKNKCRKCFFQIDLKPKIRKTNFQYNKRIATSNANMSFLCKEKRGREREREREKFPETKREKVSVNLFPQMLQDFLYRIDYFLFFRQPLSIDLMELF